jgi:AcrR family transcriptional regulator
MAKSQEIVAIVSKYGHINQLKSTQSRLVDTLIALWADLPIDQLSVRSVIHHADVALSAIHYHFGNLERLYLAASDTALERAKVWMTAQRLSLASFAGQPLPSSLQASILTSLIADWTMTQRPLAIAARRAPSAAWLAAQDGFWQDAAHAIGLSDHATTIACFAHGETARHLLVCHPALDRALLEETVAALLAWLAEARLVPETTRPAHQAHARAGYHAPMRGADPHFMTVAGAAADLLSRKGHAGITFRAVATEAGVTLGKVIHLFGSKSELLRCALHRLYEREALGDQRDLFVAQSLPPQAMMEHLLKAVLTGRQPVLRAYDEIELAIYNGAEFHTLRGMVRSMDDPSGAWALKQLSLQPFVPGSLVAAFSAVIRGLGFRASLAADDPVAIEDFARRVLRPFVARA